MRGKSARFRLAGLALLKKETTTIEAGADRHRRANGQTRARVVRKAVIINAWKRAIRRL
jgi:hypothetical protein